MQSTRIEAADNTLTIIVACQRDCGTQHTFVGIEPDSPTSWAAILPYVTEGVFNLFEVEEKLAAVAAQLASPEEAIELYLATQGWTDICPDCHAQGDVRLPAADLQVLLETIGRVATLDQIRSWPPLARNAAVEWVDAILSGHDVVAPLFIEALPAVVEPEPEPVRVTLPEVESVPVAPVNGAAAVVVELLAAANPVASPTSVYDAEHDELPVDDEFRAVASAVEEVTEEPVYEEPFYDDSWDSPEEVLAEIAIPETTLSANTSDDVVNVDADGQLVIE